MVNFRKTLMVVASLAACAGMAAAQELFKIDTTQTKFTANLVRSEGVTEAMPTINFTVSTPAATGYDVTLISTAPITSTKAALQFKGQAASTISGNAATFSDVEFTLLDTAFTLQGLRIDATQLPSLSSGQTTGLGENVIIIMSSRSGTGYAAPFDGTSPITTITGLGYAVNSLTVAEGNAAGTTTGKPISYFQCASTNPFDPATSAGAAAFSVTLAEGFGTAWQNLNGENPFTIVDATQATQFSLTFSNVPANVTLYVPINTNNHSVSLTLVAPATPTLSTDGHYAAVPASGKVVYGVVSATSAADTTWVPVYVSFNAKTVPALTTSTAPLTVTGTYAPQSTNSGMSTSKDLIPRFLGAAQSSSAFAPTIAACNSTILFPYVVSGDGYNTGLAISNAGILGNDGGQSGTCQWSFYGDGAPTTAVAPTAAIDPGKTYTALLSDLAPNLNGFAVASCNFEGGYGYAYIVSGMGSTEVAQGYLGLVGAASTSSFGFFPQNNTNE